MSARRRSGPARRQRAPAPLVVGDGDLLWKLWISTVHEGVFCQALSCSRAAGGFTLVFVFHRPGRDGEPVVRYWTKELATPEEVLEFANDFVVHVSDEHMHFRLVDLSELRTPEEQIRAIEEEGLSILGVYRTGRRPAG